MIEHYRMRRDDTGSEYTRVCDRALLEARMISKRFRIGAKFRCISQLDGGEYTESLIGMGYKGKARTKAFLLKSDAMGINPDQKIEAMKADEALGVKVEYDDAGRAIFRSKGQYKRYAEAHGFYDRNAGYSEPKRRDEREREIMGLPQVAYPAEAYE
ncbi:MAG: hypothetical protein ACYCQK_01470 [Acidiferrobacteraceae bacterium]